MSLSSLHLAFRISLAQLMTIVLIVTLCVAPLTSALKTGNGILILGAVVLDVVAIPLLATLLAVAFGKSTVQRDWYYRAIWLTPPLFVGAFLMVLIPILFYINPFHH